MNLKLFMIRYKILHIPTGHYLKNYKNSDILLNSKKEAQIMIDNNLKWHAINSTYSFCWNEYNADIGEGISKEEFEIIKLGE